ncbi:TetR/AcrR family transcriptional regulator [Phenylobacterium sp.]|uniref:TetR/AcrR family transcriptional regulator n=1 Tax=Phenylobacterium sp. TaxID=1871053 RepID=UPI0027305FD9|nr:TetR/AcrR family transcriptional regulator [Phenylobacterium sp.]MDP1618398.1 TetR/AcrR family transcriptional regulator [Phenylobacterium sp.]MDP1987378.1 TetR/AcrR family transcriptional regulator [Phenylobacterium sp.]
MPDVFNGFIYRSMQKSDQTSAGDFSARGRGRPRTFDREAALGRATCLFWSKGFEATSITDLTQAMGIGAPSLYAAFGSKEALYAEALSHYLETNEHLAWAGFFAAKTARDAVMAFLMDSAAALASGDEGAPRGCMVTLSAVGSEGHAALGEMVRAARTMTFDRIKARLDLAVAEGEIPASIDTHGLARFVQTVQNGMSLLARDEAAREELEAVAEVAMLGWDARAGRQSSAPA